MRIIKEQILEYKYVSRLTVAGIYIIVKSDLEIIYTDKTRIFMINEPEKCKNRDADVVYNVLCEHFCIPREAKKVYDTTNFSVYSDDLFYYTDFYVADDYIHSHIFLKRKKVFDKDYYMYIEPGTETYFFDKFEIFGYMAFEEVLINYGAVILHSSFVKWNERGILFSAPSGIGKSTQADLWNKYMGAEIINGDRTVIRKDVGKYHGYGSVFAGSSGIYKNDRAEIEAIVCLSQNKYNIISRDKPAVSFAKLYSQIIVNTWNYDFQKRVIDIVEDIIDGIPIYHLSCLPDKGAVETLAEHIGRK